MQCPVAVITALRCRAAEYLCYVTFGQDGTIAFDVKLTGELSTNVLTPAEEAANRPEYGTLVAPGVSAQVHQHMFCYRLDPAIDGAKSRVIESTVEAVPLSDKNPYGNAFRVKECPLASEAHARRPEVPRGGAWRIESANGTTNPITGRPPAYKLVPQTRGTPQPLLLAHPDSAVSKRGEWATAALWVTPYDASQRFPAGEFPTQSIVDQPGRPLDGVARWSAADRSVDGEALVLWHTFGVAHVPRIEEFPVMPVEVVGFALKPDGFCSGNPAVALPPPACGASKQTVIPAE